MQLRQPPELLGQLEDGQQFLDVVSVLLVEDELDEGFAAARSRASGAHHILDFMEVAHGGHGQYDGGGGVLAHVVGQAVLCRGDQRT